MLSLTTKIYIISHSKIDFIKQNILCYIKIVYKVTEHFLIVFKYVL